MLCRCCLFARAMIITYTVVVRFFFFKQKTAYEMRISDWSADVCSSDLLRAQAKGPLFRTIARGTKRLSDTPLPQANAFAMVRRRAVAAEIGTAIGNHSFRATGITTYLKNGGTLETAATMANHSSTRRSEEHTSELQSLMRISYAVFCLKKKKNRQQTMPPH